MCIGLPPTDQFSIDLAPSALIFRNQSIKGTLVSSLADVDETLAFAQRGICYSLMVRETLLMSIRKVETRTGSCWNLTIQRCCANVEKWQGGWVSKSGQ